MWWEPKRTSLNKQQDLQLNYTFWESWWSDSTPSSLNFFKAFFSSSAVKLDALVFTMPCLIPREENTISNMCQKSNYTHPPMTELKLCCVLHHIILKFKIIVHTFLTKMRKLMVPKNIPGQSKCPENVSGHLFPSLQYFKTSSSSLASLCPVCKFNLTWDPAGTAWPVRRKSGNQRLLTILLLNFIILYVYLVSESATGWLVGTPQHLQSPPHHRCELPHPHWRIPPQLVQRQPRKNCHKISVSKGSLAEKWDCFPLRVLLERKIG